MSATAIFPSADPVAPLLAGKNGTAASPEEEQAFAALLGGGSVSDIVLASLARQAAPDARLQENGFTDRPIDAPTPQRDLQEAPEAPLDRSRPQQQVETDPPSAEDAAPRSPEAAAFASSSDRTVPDEPKSGRTTPATTQSNATADQSAAAQSRAASTQAQPSATQNAGLRANVTDTPAELLSQPSNTLTANAAVVAQNGTDSRVANPATVGTTVGLAAQNAQQRALGKDSDARTPGKLASEAAAAKAAPQTNNPASAVPATDAFNAMLATQTAAAQQPAPAPANAFARADQAVLAGSGSTGQPVARQAAGPAPMQPPKLPVPPRLVTNQVAVQIQKAAAQGSDRINIQLKPAELGRVEVQMDVAKDGRVTAVISAERSETLDLLQRDARALQNALNDAGLRTDSDSLSFNLKGQNQAQSDGEKSDGQAGGDGALGDESDGPESAARQDIVSNDRVDIEV